MLNGIQMASFVSWKQCGIQFYEVLDCHGPQHLMAVITVLELRLRKTTLGQQKVLTEEPEETSD